MNNSHHGWIKLEVPMSRNSEKVMAFMVSDLKRTLRKYRINVDSSQRTRTVEEQHCEVYYEKNLEVTCERFSSSLLGALQEHLTKINNVSFQPYERGTLALHSADVWTTNLICHVQAVPLTAIYFGNIQGGVFLNHWEISFWKDTIRRLEGHASKDISNFITAEFEFDKKDLLTIHFECTEKNRVKRNVDEPAHYQLTIRRESIRRIIVDPAVSDSYGIDRVRVHFELNFPVLLRRGVVDVQKRGNRFAIPFYHRRTKFYCEWGEHGHPEPEALADSPVFTIEFYPSVSMEEIYRILSRLSSRTGAVIEFARIPSVDVPIGKRYPYNRWTLTGNDKGGVPRPTDKNSHIYNEFLEHCFTPNRVMIKGKEIDLSEERKFAITYLIECLLSRGAVVKDQLLLEEIHWERFLEVIIIYYKKDDKLCEAALEDLVHLVDGKKRIGSLIQCLDRICQYRLKQKLVNGLTEQEERDGYMRVRKLIFTPTRVIYVAPETLMGNRVLRKFDSDGTQILRITFRDDNNQKMRSTGTEDLLEKTAGKYLGEGIRVANREYGFLGCSNSQMRDNGAYFMQKYTDKQFRNARGKGTDVGVRTFFPKIRRARHHLGRFELVDNIPKMMARLGQCFTQSRMSGMELPRSSYLKIADLSGGKNLFGKNYEFSDGVGMMSAQFAELASKNMGFGTAVPSCFQIRFRGMKGVVAIEPLLDHIRLWRDGGAIEYEYDTEDVRFNFSCAFRPSQIKFNSKAFEGEQLELVKFSSPVPVALNKPFINIMDQVSEMQSIECHRRVTSRIEELLDRQMRFFARQMNNEVYCRNKLNEFPRRYNFDVMRTMWGFTLSSEPFFRSLIKASIKFSITKQIRKEQIPIPSELGRSMLGVVDETGRLQYGQIFVQYTRNLSFKLPPPNAARQVLTGAVLLTKNPCIVAGDVRIFEAVDIPELHHLCDVVVFPQHGPRPHPDEMAGSDLDGDEYSVIWDPELLLDRNEEPFDFAVEKEVIPYDPEKIDQLMKEFYVTYLKLDSVGQISNSHLHCSDQFGINAEVCMNLAKKNSQAVDFTKSGKPPDPLVREWVEKDGVYLPPEVPERIPDYHLGNDRDPVYVSPRLCGKLFREFKAVDDVIKISEERDEQLEITIDETIHVPGYEIFMDRAKQDLANYNGQLRAIMENYGIKTEGEIISGCIIDMRNRISEKDQDDMSFYNTNQMIETKISDLIRRSREEFFTEFGGFRCTTKQMPKAYDETNVLHYLCEAPTNEMMQKAVAWYRACYEEAQNTKEIRKLSFAWLVYDVIAKVKERTALDSEVIEMGGQNPLYKMLEAHRQQYLVDNSARFQSFKTGKVFKSGEDKETANAILKMYMHKNPKLDVVLFLLLEWADVSRLFEKSSMRKHHFALLVILFAIRHLNVADETAVTFFLRIDRDQYEQELERGVFQPNEPFAEEKQSELMVKFFEFLASRKFRKLQNLSFLDLGYSSIFMRGEWEVFHVAALKTYYNILFNLRFEELPISTDPESSTRVINREIEPFVVELPKLCDLSLVREKLLEHSGVEEIVLRQLEKKAKAEGSEEKETVRHLVSARGTLEAMQRLKLLVAVSIPIKSHLGGKDVSKQMAFLCLKRILEGLS